MDQVLIVHFCGTKAKGRRRRKAKVTGFIKVPALSSSSPSLWSNSSFDGVPSLETQLILVSIRSWYCQLCPIVWEWGLVAQQGRGEGLGDT